MNNSKIITLSGMLIPLIVTDGMLKYHFDDSTAITVLAILTTLIAYFTNKKVLNKFSKNKAMIEEAVWVYRLLVGLTSIITCFSWAIYSYLIELSKVMSPLSKAMSINFYSFIIYGFVFATIRYIETLKDPTQ